jgi:hypothetical protein
MKFEEQEVRVEIRDKWQHYALPLDTVIKPLFEQQIYGRDPATLVEIWKRYGFSEGTCKYRGDIPIQSTNSNEAWTRLFDGATWQNSTYWAPGENTLNSIIDWPEKVYIYPWYFTIDMVKPAKYSRMRHWGRSRAPLLSANFSTSIEIWGTNNPKDITTIGDGSQADNLKYWTQWPLVAGPDDCKNDWVKLADWEMNLPSGAKTSAEVTTEDAAFMAAGFEIEIFPEQTDKVFRYLRFVVRSQNFNSNITICEISFWGAYAD